MVAATRIVVVGANGFLGRALAARLVERGDEVTGVVARRREAVPAGVRVTTELATDELPEIVFVTAAFIPYGAMDVADPRLFESNVALVQRVHERWPHARLVSASSVAIFGESPVLRTEDAPSERPSLYGLSKLAGELPARLHRSHAIVRFSSLVGVGMDRRTFVPRVVDQARRERSITLFGDGLRRADYLHVEDAVDLLLAAANASENGTFLGASSQPVANHEVARFVAERLPGTTIVQTGRDPSPSFEYDASRTYRSLGYRPRRTVFTALEELIADE